MSHSPRSRRRFNKRRYTCERRMPHGCSGEGANGARGRAKWLRISNRKLRHAENQALLPDSPHRTSILRCYGTRSVDRYPEDDDE